MPLSLFGSVAIFYAILILINLPAPFLGLEFEDGAKPRLWYQPPGFVIPIAWFVLFTLLGIARYRLTETGNDSWQWWLIGLAVLCAAYAYYTLGLAGLTGISALWFGLIGNIVVITVAAYVSYRLFPVSPPAAWLVLPVAAWTTFATLIVIGEMKLEGLL